MKVKQFSTVCFVTLISIGVFLLPAQAATQKEQFLYRLVAILKTPPNLPGDEAALTSFATMDDAGRENVFGMGKSYCIAILSGMSSQDYSVKMKKKY